MTSMPRSENDLISANVQQKTAHRQSPTTSDTSPFIERHYSASELAALWNLSLDTIRRIFENEPGVLVLGEDKPKRNRRRYTTLRIPESVAARVHRRLSKV
jgi:hypothetical protein